MKDTLWINGLVTEHQNTPMGIDVKNPRFGWKLQSKLQDVVQTAYQLQLFADQTLAADTGKVESDASTEVVIEGWEASPMTRYEVVVHV